MSLHYKKVYSLDMLERDEDEYPRENGQRQSNKTEMGTKSEKSAQRDPDLVDHPGKYRSTFDIFSVMFLCFEFSFIFCKLLYVDGQEKH